MQIKPFPDLDNIAAIAIPVPDVSNHITVNLYAAGTAMQAKIGVHILPLCTPKTPKQTA
jgi:hypothetical protein